MSNSTSESASSSPAFRPIRLRLDGTAILVNAQDQDSGEISVANPSIALPPLAKSMTDWLAIFCEIFWQRHERCVSVLLLLDLATRRWSFEVPAQRCSRDASCWTARYGVSADPSRKPVLAGTYQSRLLAENEQVSDAVPPIPGAHFVHVIEQTCRGVYTFLRIDEELHALQPQVLIVDDLEAMMAECRPRVRLL